MSSIPTPVGPRSQKAPRGPKASAATFTKLEKDALVVLIRREPTAAALAHALGVSLATTHRLVASLRRKGEPISTFRRNQRWRYQVRTRRSEAEIQSDPLIMALGMVKRWKRLPAQTEDQIIYGKR